MRCIILVIILLGLRFPAVFAEEDHSRDRLNGIVFGGIAELISVRDSVTERYALMVTNEYHDLYINREGRSPVEIDRGYRLQAACRDKTFEYYALGRVIAPENSSKPYEFQVWVELYKRGLVTKGRIGPATRHGYIVRDSDVPIKRFVESNGLDGANFQPFDDLVTHTMFVANSLDQTGWIENVFMVESELISADRITQGDILSKWRWKRANLDFEIELTQSKAFGYLPVHVKYTSKIKERPNWFSVAEIKWRKHAGSGQFLPHVFRSACGAPFGPREEHHQIVFNWRIGNELPDSFFDGETDDFRQAFTPVFDFHFDTYAKPGGLLTGTPWKTPDELAQPSGVSK